MLLFSEFSWAIRGVLLVLFALAAANLLGVRFTRRRQTVQPMRSIAVQPKGLEEEVEAVESVLAKHARGEAVSAEERDQALMALDRLHHRLEGTRKEEVKRYIESGLELSKSEREVLKLMREGHTPQRIARILGCSLSRIYKARSGLRVKLNVPEGMGLQDYLRSLPD
ncbi:MAG: helix-turn-helix transcriptional regulator [Flavobacteriales bacterium]